MASEMVTLGEIESEKRHGFFFGQRLRTCSAPMVLD